MRLCGSLVVIRPDRRVFSCNSLVKTMEINCVILYISTAAQSFGSQDYYNKSLMMIRTLAGVLLCESSFVQKKILTLVHWEAKGGLKASAGKRVAI